MIYCALGIKNRPRLFDLNIQLPELLYGEVAEIEERIAADGQVLQPCNIAQATQALAAAFAKGYRSVAIALIAQLQVPPRMRKYWETWPGKQDFRKSR